jgi:hypothetical protein
MQRRGRFVGQWTRIAESRVWQRLQREQHRRRLFAGLARLLRQNRERARLLYQRTIALLVGGLCRLIGEVTLLVGRCGGFLGQIPLLVGRFALFLRERLLDLSLIALVNRVDGERSGQQGERESGGQSGERAPRDAFRLLRLPCASVGNVLEPLRLRALPADVHGLARLDELRLQGGRRRRLFGLVHDPFVGQPNVRGGQKPAVRGLSNLLPLLGKAQIAGMLAQPIRIDIEGVDQFGEPGPEA